MSTNVWFVTGASKGLGLALVKQLLKKDYQVAATSRNVTSLAKVVNRDSYNFLPLEVDLTNETSVQQAIEETIAAFGSIDVVVNNAGYGLVGSFEHLTDQEVRQNFDVNVFGTINVIRKVMPYLREQGSGHIFNISSVSGYTGEGGGGGSYNATKFAVVGLSEALADDVKSFGIKVTIVAPGLFRTKFHSSDSLMFGKNHAEEYETILGLKDQVNAIAGKQPGDPDKAALAMMRAATETEPPTHLLLGSDAYRVVSEKLAALQTEFDTWKELSCSTNYEV